jgi:hypothetical protein
MFMETKQCTVCREEKTLEFFRRRGKKNLHLFYNQCRECESKAVMKWRDSKPEARESYRKSARDHYKNNKEKKLLQINESKKKMYEKFPHKKIERSLRCRCRQALQGKYKSATTQKLLGTSFEEARKYLESQWQDGMSWDNYGLHGWHIDHIVPLSSFDLTIVEEQIKAFHYTNLQPLWAKDNLRKGNKTQ